MQRYFNRVTYFSSFIFLLLLFSSVALKASQDEQLEPASYQNVRTIIDTHLRENANLLESSRNKDIVVFLGASGSGKSTLVNFLNSRPLRVNNFHEWELENPQDPSSMKIGHQDVSEILLPKCIEKEGLVFYDLAGFRDTRGTAINLVNASFIKHLIENARSTRVVFVAGQDEITSNRSDSFNNLLKIIDGLFARSIALENSSLLVITKSDQKTDTDLISFLERRITNRGRLNTWLHPNRISPISRTIEDNQREIILEKVRSIPFTVIKNVNIEAIYSEELRNTLKRIFASEMKKILEETVSPVSPNPISIEDINKAKTYFKGTFKKAILDNIEDSSLITLFKPLAENSFAEEQQKLLRTIKQTRESKLSELKEKKKKLEKQEEDQKLRTIEDTLVKNIKKMELQIKDLQNFCTRKKITEERIAFRTGGYVGNIELYGYFKVDYNDPFDKLPAPCFYWKTYEIWEGEPVTDSNQTEPVYKWEKTGRYHDYKEYSKDHNGTQLNANFPFINKMWREGERLYGNGLPLPINEADLHFNFN